MSSVVKNPLVHPFLLTVLQEGQDALQNVATDTLQIMADGQKEVLSKQEVLKESQVNLQEIPSPRSYPAYFC